MRGKWSWCTCNCRSLNIGSNYNGALNAIWIKARGARYLQAPEIAAMVETALYHFDGERYQLLAWVIMPNHVHLLLTPDARHSLGEIMRSLKSYTAHEANRLLGRTGKFWFEDYFDRYIRDADHYATVVRYIENNPVKAGLCSAPEEWRYGSAWWRHRSSDVLGAR